MFRKIFSTLILAAVIFIGSQNFVEARDVYVGTSNTTGWDCYLMTETMSGDSRACHVTLKMVTQSGRVSYLNYFIFIQDHHILFENSQGHSGRVTQYGTPIEWNMYRVIEQYS